MFRWLVYGAVFLAILLSGLRSTGGQEPSAAAPRSLPEEFQSWLVEPPESAEQWETHRAMLRLWLLTQLAQPAEAKADFHAVGRTDGDAYTVEELQFVTGTGEITRSFVLVPSDHVGRGPAMIYFANQPPSGGGTAQRLPTAEDLKAVDEFLEAGYGVMVVYPSVKAKQPGPKSAGQDVDWSQTARADFWLVRYFFAHGRVDADRVAVFGVGVAARRAWWIAALEQRVAAVVTFGGLESPYRATQLAGDQEATVLLRLIAPRPHCMLLDRDVDQGLHKAVDSQADYYRLYDLESLLQTSWASPKEWTPGSPRWQEACQWLKGEL